jgi:hypothetical protein
MKRCLLVLSLIVFSIAAWGQNGLDLSFGGGALIGTDFGGGSENKISYMQQITVSLPMDYFAGGMYAFFDATYMEVSAGLLFGGGTLKIKVGSPLNYTVEIGDYNFTGLNLGISGKYPVMISSKLKLFPLIGIDYLTILSLKLEDENTDNPMDWNQLWFKFGGGLDYEINTSLYFRVEALYGFRLSSKAEKDYADDLKAAFQDEFYQQYAITPKITAGTLLGHGLTAKAAIGYRL